MYKNRQRPVCLTMYVLIVFVSLINKFNYQLVLS